jgi:hypothetical protein
MRCSYISREFVGSEPSIISLLQSSLLHIIRLQFFALEEFYRDPSKLAAEMTRFEEACFNESNVQCVNSYTIVDDQGKEGFYHINPDHAD